MRNEYRELRIGYEAEVKINDQLLSLIGSKIHVKDNQYYVGKEKIDEQKYPELVAFLRENKYGIQGK